MIPLNYVMGIIIHEMKKFNYKFEIFRNSTLKNLGVLRGSF